MGRRGGYFRGKLDRTYLPCIPICAGALWVAALIVRLTTTSPYIFLHSAAGRVPLPPTWLLGCVWLTYFALIGAAWGYILGMRAGRPHQDAGRFRGSMYFLLCVVFALLWYRLLFGAWAVFLSWLSLLLSLAAGVAAALCWWRVSRVVGGIMLAFALWLLFLLGCQGVVILHL